MPRATLLIGEPCTGKSTLMRAFLGLGQFAYIPGGGMPRHEDFRGKCVVFGRYDEEHPFPGTDRLHMGIKPVAMEYAREYHTRGWHVLWEGSRLGNGKTIREMQGIGFDVRIGVTVVDGEELAVRRALERSQPPVMVKRCGTQVLNLVKAFPELVTLLRCDRETDTPRNLAWMRGLPGAS